MLFTSHEIQARAVTHIFALSLTFWLHTKRQINKENVRMQQSCLFCPAQRCSTLNKEMQVVTHVFCVLDTDLADSTQRCSTHLGTNSWWAVMWHMFTVSLTQTLLTVHKDALHISRQRTDEQLCDTFLLCPWRRLCWQYTKMLCTSHDKELMSNCVTHFYSVPGKDLADSTQRCCAHLTTKNWWQVMWHIFTVSLTQTLLTMHKDALHILGQRTDEQLCHTSLLCPWHRPCWQYTKMLYTSQDKELINSCVTHVYCVLDTDLADSAQRCSAHLMTNSWWTVAWHVYCVLCIDLADSTQRCSAHLMTNSWWTVMWHMFTLSLTQTLLTVHKDALHLLLQIADEQLYDTSLLCPWHRPCWRYTKPSRQSWTPQSSVDRPNCRKCLSATRPSCWCMETSVPTCLEPRGTSMSCVRMIPWSSEYRWVVLVMVLLFVFCR